MRALSFFILTIFFGTPLLPQETIDLNDQMDNVLVGKGHLEVLEDTTNLINIQQLLKGSSNLKFQKASSDFSGIKNTDATYWIRFSVQVDSLSTRNWLVEILDLHIDHVETYKVQGGHWEKVNTTGYSHLFHDRLFYHKNFVYRIPTSSVKHSAITYYFKIRSNKKNTFLLKLRSDEFFVGYAVTEYFLLALFYGILLIMAVYNLLIYFSVKEKFYLYYVFYVITCILISFSEDGIGFQYLWPDIPILNTFLELYMPIVYLYCFILYANSFLHLKENTTFYYRLIKWGMWIYPFYYFIIVVLLERRWEDMFYIAPFFLVYIAAIKIFSKGYKPARLFIFGFTFTLIGIVLMVLRRSGIIIWDGVFYVYSFNFGLLFEVVLFSLALADRLKEEKSDKEKAQEKVILQLQENEKIISQEVSQRTDEVIQKKQEIETKNAQLQTVNEQLVEQKVLLEHQAEQLKEQSEEIQRMNQILNSENLTLQSNVNALRKARVLMREVDFEEFSTIFPDDESCYKYLSELKWKDGYQCIRCHNTSHSDSAHHAKRCSKCGYNEPSTKGTIFYRSRFPILKGFYMLFLLYSNHFKVTAREMSETLDLRLNTCWKFSTKVQRKKEQLESENKDILHDGWDALIQGDVEDES